MLKKIFLTNLQGFDCGGYTVCLACSQFLVFDWIFFILAGNKDMHISMNEIEFQPDLTTDYRVTCLLASEKSINNALNTLAPSFLAHLSRRLTR